MTRKPLTTLLISVALGASAYSLAGIAREMPPESRLAAAMVLATWCILALAYAPPRSRPAPPLNIEADGTPSQPPVPGEVVTYTVQMRPQAPWLDLRWQDSPLSWDDVEKAHAERRQWARRVAASGESVPYEFRVVRTAVATVPEPGEPEPVVAPGKLSLDDLMCPCPSCGAESADTAEAQAAIKANGLALFRALAPHGNASALIGCPKDVGEGLMFVCVGPAAKLVAPILFSALSAAKTAYHIAKATVVGGEPAPHGTVSDHFMGNPSPN